MPQTLSHPAFWQRFEERTAPFHLLRHPFYQAWSRGELSQADLAEYAAEYWHHVAAFPTYLSALHSRLPDGELRREVLRNLVEEEGVERAGNRPHSELWMDFAEGTGATRAGVLHRQVQPETNALLVEFRDGMQACSPVESLAKLFAYESRVPAIAAEKAAGLKKHYGADDRTARYFTLHETADVQHARVWQGLIEAELEAHPAAAEGALAAGERAARALWAALDGIERERLRRNALAA